MLRTRGRKIIQDVLSRKGRTLLVSAAIFVGVAGTIALFTMRESLISQQEKDIQEERLAMAKVVVNAVSGAELDHAAYLQTLQHAPGVTNVMGGIESQTVYFKRTEADSTFEEGHIQAYAVVNEGGQLMSVFGDDAPIEPLRLEAGTYPRAGMKEIAVEKRLADQYGLKVGDSLYFRVFSTLERWTVSGLVFDAYSGQDKPQEAIFAHVEDAASLVGLSGFTHFWFRFTDFPTADSQIDSIVNAITATMPYIPTATITEDPQNSTLLQGARITGSLMSSLAITALMVSGFLVINVISAIVIEQKRQIGVMKSLGASRMDTMLIYSGVALAYGILGVIPGVLVGIPAGNMAAKGIAPEMNIILHGFQWSAFSIGLGILLGVLVPVLASLLPVFNGTRVKILEAMTDLGIDTRYGGGILAAFIRWLPLP
ncbi:MAG: ABC transporter permease, partial [Anaerolineae bacterium]|nr:ABC transporter permease [Anaerolineae bacterium]